MSDAGTTANYYNCMTSIPLCRRPIRPTNRPLATTAAAMIAGPASTGTKMAVRSATGLASRWGHSQHVGRRADMRSDDETCATSNPLTVACQALAAGWIMRS